LYKVNREHECSDRKGRGALGSQNSEKMPRKSIFQANSVNQGECDVKKRQSIKSKNHRDDVEKVKE
jgi:hypothetical protein